MKRHFLSKRDSSEFINIMSKFGINVDVKTVELEENDVSLIFVEGIPTLLKYNDQWLPTAKAMLDRGFPYVVVDEGAARSIKKGAKLYAAGIVKTSGELKVDGACIIADVNGNIIGSGIVKSNPEDIKNKVKGAYIMVYERI